jgi:16S rRNA (cytidine1402-2'-O)-methyltransferase
MGEILSYFKEHTPKGEFTLVLAGEAESKEGIPGTEEIREELRRLILGGKLKKEAVKEVSRHYKIPKNDVYKISLEDDFEI